jgi:hypothetical protein
MVTSVEVLGGLSGGGARFLDDCRIYLTNNAAKRTLRGGGRRMLSRRGRIETLNAIS